MLCLGVSWSLGLWAHLSHYFSIITLPHFFTSHCSCSSSYSWSYLLLVLLHLFSTLINVHPQFITWRIVTFFPLSIPRTLIWRALGWEGHLVRESLCYTSTWEYVYPFFDLIFEAHLFMFKVSVFEYMLKKKHTKKKIKISTCVYVHSILHH